MSDDVQDYKIPGELYEALLEEKRAAKEDGPRPVVSKANEESVYIQLPVTGRTISTDNVVLEGFIKNGAFRREGNSLVIMRA